MDPESSSRPKWARRKESRPAELVEAALDIFVERGFAATRLDDVAARAGVSKGTLYLYYPSKEDLFKAVISETVVPLIAGFRDDIQRSDATTGELLAQYFREWWRHFGATRLAGIAKLVVAEAGNFPELARYFQEQVAQPGHALLQSLIHRGIDRGEFRAVDVETVAHLWIAPLVLRAIWQHSILPCCPGTTLDPGRMLAVHIEMMLESLRPVDPWVEASDAMTPAGSAPHRADARPHPAPMRPHTS
jgi:AcrR family transcriptional regulator